MQNIKFGYNKEVSSLWVYNEDRKADASIELGEIIITLDKENRLVAVEILNPDVLFQIPKNKLSKISSASMSAQFRGNIMWIHILLRIQNETEPISIPVPLAQPMAVHN
ncbi:MAG: DUF2283 domain-containing protein [Candidatus Aenigmatarchaeota archaeon]